VTDEVHRSPRRAGRLAILRKDDVLYSDETTDEAHPGLIARHSKKAAIPEKR